MTRKTNDNIGHFGRSFSTKRQEYSDYEADLEKISAHTYEIDSSHIVSQFLSPKSIDDLEVQRNLESAYQILSYLKLDDHTYTHLSSRSAGEDYYYINSFNLCFDEITKDNLIKVNVNDQSLDEQEFQYNKTGYVIHSSIYRSRPDISTVFHLHTPAMVAVSSIECGLLPLSQWALHFYEKISYHNYDSLVLDDNRQGSDIARDLKANYVMLMRNHGALICGRTIHEAMFYTYHLELACKTQLMMQSTAQSLIIPPKNICSKAVKELLSFEEDLGMRDWNAWKRKISKTIK